MTIDTFLSQLTEHCGISADKCQIEVDEGDEVVEIKLEVPQEDSGLLIGHHGDTLDSLQRIARIVFQEKYGDKKIVLNINDYREQRQEKLIQMIETAAQKILDHGGEFVFNSYLPANERYFIHSKLGEDERFSSLESVSKGSGKDRRLTIRLRSQADNS